MLDPQNEMPPPWQVFPTYERYTIGWRMGYGEQYRYEWYDFLKEIPKNFESRLAYLKRHRPAPLNWANQVFEVLYPKKGYDKYKPKNLPELLKLGLVEHDAAYKTWLIGQTSITWPWKFSDTPEEVARYRTREFWFFSRQLKTMRELNQVDFEEIPDIWQEVAEPLQTGILGNIDPQKGLLTLAQMLCVGSVEPPWTLGLSLDDFAENFEMDMGYVDAFGLWIMCSFDDDALLRELLEKTEMSAEWNDWVDTMTDFS